jgi:RNA polymerase sigma-70 factor (ECF subfamily)
MTNQALTTQQIWHDLNDKLKGFYAARVANEQTVSDLLQETFLRIHQNIHRINDRQRVSAWVFQIARNLVMDHYRGTDQRQSQSAADLDTLEADTPHFNAEVAGWLPALIEHLPEPYRQALRLYEIEAMPQQQIAHQLGISLSGVKSRIQRGRDKLKDLLHQCCFFELDSEGNILDYGQQNADSDCGPCTDLKKPC